MRRIISPAIAAVVVAAGLLLAILSGYTPNMFPDLVRDHPVRFWGSMIGLFALLIGYAFAQAQQQFRPTPVESGIDPQLAARNRQAMLENVRRTWIAGVLDRSVAKDARIALGLEARPDAVINPVDLVVQRPDRTAQQLPAGTTIRDIYDQMGRALLILGAPGAGKTTLLLELARDLLDRANDDPQHPIPVVFLLSTWATQRHPLAEWLVDELVQRYQVSRKLAQAWIDGDVILPLLDGLDEVADLHRNACADAINAYRQTRGHLRLVVSSRIADYEALTTRLQLHGAILAQPLHREQVRSYLRAVGVAAIPSSTSPLWDLLDTPLMLTVAALAYAGQPLATLPADPVAARDRLFAAYIDRMFKRNTARPPFTDAQTRHYLAFIAHHMQQHNQTTLYLENLQPDWLPIPPRRYWRISIMLGGALVWGLVGALVWGLVVGLVGALGGGLVGALGGGLGSGWIDSIGPTEAVRWSWSEARSRCISNLRKNLLRGLVGALVFGLVWGLVVELVVGLVGALSGALVGALIKLVFGGLSEQTIAHKTSPNQGVRQSGIHAIMIGLGSALVFGLVWGLVVGLVVGLVSGFGIGWGVRLVFGLVSGLGGGLIFRLVDLLVGGLSLGLVVGLLGGGRAYIQHYVLRLLLIRTGSLPLRPVPFLDYAAQRIFLRRVGGGYIFIHRLLLEHFAAQYIPSHTTTSAPASHTRHVP